MFIPLTQQVQLSRHHTLHIKPKFCCCIVHFREPVVSPPRQRHTLCPVRVLWCINNLETYAGDSTVADGTTDARQIQIELPDEERYPGPPGWELGCGVNLETVIGLK